MARNRTKPAPPLCTYCGKPAFPVTEDHVIPRALWPDVSKDRPIKVASCKACNNRSNESILKHFFIVLDGRFYPETLEHFKTDAGKTDFRAFKSMWAEINGQLHLYADEKITSKFVRMFMGLRRYLLGRAWYYVPAEGFTVFKIDRGDSSYESRMLPLKVGAPNQKHLLARQFTDELNKPMRHKFRDFRFDSFADDEKGVVIGLKYEREEFAHLGNRLYLLCFVPRIC